MPIPDQNRYEVMNVEEDLWRYISLDHLANLLRTDELLFRRISCFSDPFEGSVPKAFVERRREIYEESDSHPDHLPNVLSAVNKRVRDSVYANCWHRSNIESEAMWEHYGNSGVAVVTDIDSIFESLEKEDRTILIKEVPYLNYYASYDELSAEEQSTLEQVLEYASSDLLAPAIMKRKSFKHENEVRLLRPEVELISEREYEDVQANIEVDDQEWKQPIFVNMDGENGAVDLRSSPEKDKQKIHANLDTLINEIRIAPGAKEWFQDTVEEVVDSVGPDSITPDRVRPSNTDLNEQRF